MKNLNEYPTSSRRLPQTWKLIHFPRSLLCFQTPAVCSLFPGCHPFRAFWVGFPFFRPQAFVSEAQLRSIWYKAFVWGKFPLQHLCSFPGEGLCFPGLCLLYGLQVLISLFLPLTSCLFSFSGLLLCLEFLCLPRLWTFYCPALVLPHCCLDQALLPRPDCLKLGIEVAL